MRLRCVRHRRALLVALTALGALIAGGCHSLEPRWLIDRLPGTYPEVTYYFPTDQRAVALTIDDGPDPRATPQLLDVLAEHGAQATFFLLSDAMRKEPELVQQILAAGHEIGNHMARDAASRKLPAATFVAELDEAAAVIEGFSEPADASQSIRWFRPGHGFYNDTMKSELALRGYRIALASMLPLDARLRAPRLVARYISTNVRPGSVIVLHSVGERGIRAARALALLLPRLQRRDYEVTSLSGLSRLVEHDIAKPAADSDETP